MPAKKEDNKEETKVETKTVEPTTKSASTKAEEAPKKSSVLKWILLGCGSCLVLFLIFFAVVYMGASKLTAPATNKAQEFAKNLQSDNLSGAYELLSTEFKDTLTSKENFKELLDDDKYEPLRKIEKVSFSCKRVENEKGIASGKITLKDGSTKPFTVQLLKEGDDWKVSDFSLNEQDAASC